MVRTLYEKLWDMHTVAEDDGNTLLYIDRHLLHEVSTPHSFESMRQHSTAIHRPGTQLGVADHSVPTRNRRTVIDNPLARAQIELFENNCREFGIEYIPLGSSSQGIVHVVGPEQGFTLPGVTIVCGDSHTSTHGAFGALAFGIGASECATVMAAQCLSLAKAKTMRVTFHGTTGFGVGAKDMALEFVQRIGMAGATGYAVEFAGEAVRALSMAGRMTLCNMVIEAGSRTGLIAPDETTFAYLLGRDRSPSDELWDAAVAYWRTLKSESDACFDAEVEIDAAAIAPRVSFGTSPDESIPITSIVPKACDARSAKSLEYMGIQADTPIAGLAIDYAFVGSCTNGRIEDLRAAAEVLRGRKVDPRVTAIVVPGSGRVKKQAESEGLDQVFLAAGFEWREPGCSLCVAMNGELVPEGARCASTSNRNYEGRQGRRSRTHLMSPVMVAAAAIAGRLVDAREMQQ